MSRTLALLLLAGAVMTPAMAAQIPHPAPHLGQPADPARIAAWDIDVSPDGTGLPDGHGSVSEGARLYADKCEICHGPAGAGGAADRLTGGIGTLRSAKPIKTVASYWPYATTLFGFVRAGMPITAPRSLSAAEVYAVCAYLLSIDHIVPQDAVLDRKTLPAIVMPNRNGFRSMWPPAR
jgi:S-disulfanyl-L-cysteine oxidoreductase SoxD